MGHRLPEQLVETADSFVLPVPHRHGRVKNRGAGYDCLRVVRRLRFVVIQFFTERIFNGIEQREQVDGGEKLNVIESLSGRMSCRRTPRGLSRSEYRGRAARGCRLDDRDAVLFQLHLRNGRLNRIQHMPVADAVHQRQRERVEDASHLVQRVQVHRDEAVELRLSRRWRFSCQRHERRGQRFRQRHGPVLCS